MSDFEKRTPPTRGGDDDTIGTAAWQQELVQLLGDSARAQEIIDQVANDPRGLVDQMAHDPVLLDVLARADVASSMHAWFSDRDQIWRSALERAGRLGESAAAIEWTFMGTHDIPGTLNHLPATFRSVEVHGVSIFGAEDGKLAVRRHIDWAGLYAQLGLTLNWRVPLDPNPGPDNIQQA